MKCPGNECEAVRRRSDILTALLEGTLELLVAGFGIALALFEFVHGPSIGVRSGPRSPALAGGFVLALSLGWLLFSIGCFKWVITGRAFPFPGPWGLHEPKRLLQPGTCPYCKYSRKGISRSAPCPECGKKIP
jgi:hypothetical protein